MYSFLRGRQGIQGETGPTGPAGATGTSGNIFTTEALSPQASVTNVTIPILTIALTSGTITYFGQVSFDASALNLTTITPLINSASQGSFISKATTPLGQSNSIPVSGSGAISAGQSFAIGVVASGGGNISITSGSISYSIV